MWEIFWDLCLQNGTTPSKVAAATGITRSTFTEWKKGSQPRPNKIKKIADHFGVSINYLMGMPENKKDIPTEEDVLDDQLVAMLKKLDDNQVQRVMDFVQGMLAK